MTLRVLRFRIAPVACAARGHDDAVLLRRSKAGRPAGDKPGPPAARPSGVVNGDAERGTTRRPPATIQDHTPSFGTPSFGTPSFGTPSFGTPSFGTPSFGTPSFGTPSFGTPSFGTPSFGTASFDTASFGTASFGTASFGTASFGTASFGTASFGTASFGTASFNQSRRRKTTGVSAQHAAFPGKLGRRAGVPMQ